jgi:exosortase J
MAPTTENLEFAAHLTEEIAPALQPRWPLKAGPVLWLCIGVLAAVGCFGIYRELTVLWITWTTDPLRSIGILIPPASIVLTLRVWRQYGWQLRGSWWGLLVIGGSFVSSLMRDKTVLLGFFGRAEVNMIPVSLPVYLYVSGVVLFFAGVSVWRKAWFPLGLLMLSQPVPQLANGLIDIPLQNVAARVARAFATSIHFAPTTPQLRLMFSPDFGMFIAPGCDGIRGAVTMGYVVLIFGYLKRLSWRRWIAYVAGAALLGYIFNFIRLCVLVVYYRIALGHPALENFAKQADYAIGSCLFLIAVFLFLRVVRHEGMHQAPVETAPPISARVPRVRSVWIKCAAFALMLLVARLSFSFTMHKNGRDFTVTPENLAARMPKHIGDFTLTRTWYEQEGGSIFEENAAYSRPGSDEIILGVWVQAGTYLHDTNLCWLARGLQPDVLTTRQFVAAGGKPLSLDTGFYSDGITDSIVVNAICAPESCAQYQHSSSGQRMGFVFMGFENGRAAGPAQHPVSIMMRIDKLHSNSGKSENYDQLTAEAQAFLAGFDPANLSGGFQ